MFFCYSFKVITSVPRRPERVADQIVLGLVMNGLLGPGMMIKSRDSQNIKFFRVGAMLPDGPDKGQFILRQQESGETEVLCHLRCLGLRLRGTLLAVIIGFLAGFFMIRILGRGMVYSALAGLITGVLVELLIWARNRWRLGREVMAYLHNSQYLKLM